MAGNGGPGSHPMVRSGPTPPGLRGYFRVDYRPGERVLVQKIDFFILTFCCVSYFMNYVRFAAFARPCPCRSLPV